MRYQIFPSIYRIFLGKKFGEFEGENWIHNGGCANSTKGII